MATAVAAATGGAGNLEVDRPNILWLVSEDNNPFVGAYGDSLARTPAIDRLAREGLLFRNAYANAPVCAPSRFTILTGIHAESCAPANHMRAVATLPPELLTYPELLRSAGYFCTNASKTDYNCDADSRDLWNIQGPGGHWRKRPPGQPFMAVFNYETTHESQIFKPTEGRVSADSIRVPPYLPDAAVIRQDFASYHNLMEKMDAQIAARLAELEADGLAEDTIVFHYSDNGGVLPRSKRLCYDEGLRCVLIVRVPPKWRHLMPASPGSEIETPVSFVDLAPTLCALAGIPQPAQMQGKPLLGPAARPQPYAFAMRNRMDERIDFQRTVTDGRWRYIRNYMPHRPWGQHQAFAWLARGYQAWEAGHIAGTLTPDQSRFFQTKPFEELYDLAADPHQLRNLAPDRSQAARLARLRMALDKHMLAVNDNGFLPETMAGEGFFPSRDRAVYPLPDVMQLASLAAAGHPRSLPELRTALASPAPVLRYWAATGLLILGAAAGPAQAEMRAALANDPSPHVRIVLAEALAKLGDLQNALPALIALSGQPQSWQVRLHALNALTSMGQAALPALGTAQAAAEDENEYLRSAGKYLSLTLTGRYTPETPIFDWEALMAKARKAAG